MGARSAQYAIESGSRSEAERFLSGKGLMDYTFEERLAAQSEEFHTWFREIDAIYLAKLRACTLAIMPTFETGELLYEAVLLAAFFYRNGGAETPEISMGEDDV